MKFFLSLLAISGLVVSCKRKDFSPAGENILALYRERYKCYEIVVGDGTQTDRQGNEIKFLSVRFGECSGMLSYDSAPSDSIRKLIISDLAPQIIPKEGVSGLYLTFDSDVNSGWGKRGYLYVRDVKSGTYFLKDSSVINKFD